MAGLTDAGFVAATQAEVEADIRADVAASSALGANVNTDAETPMGQMVVIVAAAMAELWAESENIYSNGSLLTAGGVSLDNLAANYGLTRHAAVSSSVTLTIAGTASTAIPSTAAVTDALDNQWTIAAATTIGSGGTVDALFYADDTGPIAAVANSTWTIATPVSGWTGATNALDATVGRGVEADSALRARALVAARSGTASGIDGLRRAVLQVEGVTECVVIENDTASTDSDGRPAKSFEVVVRNGADADIAAAVWANKPAGIETTTTVSAPNQISEAITDATGAGRTVLASRPDEVNVYVEVDYTPRPSAPSDASIQATINEAILDLGRGLTLDAGGVYPPDVQDVIFDAFPLRIFTYFALRMGLSPSPGVAAAVPTSRTEIAVFDTSRITITRI